MKLKFWKWLNRILSRTINHSICSFSTRHKRTETGPLATRPETLNFSAFSARLGRWRTKKCLQDAADAVVNGLNRRRKRNKMMRRKKLIPRHWVETMRNCVQRNSASCLLKLIYTYFYSWYLHVSSFFVSCKCVCVCEESCRLAMCATSCPRKLGLCSFHRVAHVFAFSNATSSGLENSVCRRWAGC